MSRQIAPAGSSLAGVDAAAASHQTETREINDAEIDGYREQDRFLPINNIQRLMKNSLPDTIKVSKDAKECVQECTSEFISFITSEAAERANNEKRKTVTGDDILAALRTLGFDRYADVLLIYLAKYRNLQREGPVRKKVRTAKQVSATAPVELAQPSTSTSNSDSGSDSEDETASNDPL